MRLSERRPICNNDPASAPVVNGKPFILCWRCCGAAVGLVLAAMILGTRIPEAVTWTDAGIIVLLALPAVIDHAMNRFGLKRKSNRLRFITGIMLGISGGMTELCAVCLIGSSIASLP